MSDFGSGPIVVTGATGWVGRKVVDQLVKVLPQDEFLSRLRAFSSRSVVIEHVHGMSILTIPFTELPGLVNEEGCCYFLHVAFFTPDRCADLGIEAYTKINRLIIDTIVTAVKVSQIGWVVEFSSGAYADANQSMSFSAAQLYGALKLEEEHRLQEVGTTLVLRVYALIGRFINNPATYALTGGATAGAPAASTTPATSASAGSWGNCPGLPKSLIKGPLPPSSRLPGPASLGCRRPVHETLVGLSGTHRA